VYADINKNNSIPDFSQQLNTDIGKAITTGGMTIGGWGGAFYYWNEPYTDPITNITMSVGSAIMSSSVERDKFIHGMLTGAQALADKFGVSGLINDPAFIPALAKGAGNMLGSAPEFAANVLMDLGTGLVKYGAAAVIQFQNELIKQSGWKVSFDQLTHPSADLAAVAAGEFLDVIPGGGDGTPESEAMALAVQNKLTPLLQGKDTIGAKIFTVPSATADGEAASAVVITLASGETITVNASGAVAYRFVQPDSNGNPVWTQHAFDDSYKTVLVSPTGETTTSSYSAAHQLETVLSTATDGSSKQVDYAVPGDLQAQAITLRDPSGTTTDIRTTNPIDTSHTDTITTSAGITSASSTSAAGVTTPDLTAAAQQTLADSVQGFNDAYALSKAIAAGKPLPTLTSGIAVYNDVFHNVPPQLLGAASVVGAITSLQGHLIDITTQYNASNTANSTTTETWNPITQRVADVPVIPKLIANYAYYSGAIGLIYSSSANESVWAVAA
jgi:hypothetical protein